MVKSIQLASIIKHISLKLLTTYLLHLPFMFAYRKTIESLIISFFLCFSIFKHFLTGNKDHLNHLDDDVDAQVINGLYNVNDVIVCINTT